MRYAAHAMKFAAVREPKGCQMIVDCKIVGSQLPDDGPFGGYAPHRDKRRSGGDCPKHVATKYGQYGLGMMWIVYLLTPYEHATRSRKVTS